jgi:fatty acid-binding protein DegV
VEQLAILHINAPEAARQFELQGCAAMPCPPEMRHVELTPGLSVHTGAGVVGIMLVMRK